MQHHNPPIEPDNTPGNAQPEDRQDDGDVGLALDEFVALAPRHIDPFDVLWRFLNLPPGNFYHRVAAMVARAIRRRQNRRDMRWENRELERRRRAERRAAGL